MHARHAQLHAQSRHQESRQRVASEAARLMVEDGVRDYQVAKRKAAERLGINDDAALPRNSEIEAALRDYQRLFRGDSQQQALLRRRRAAVEAMRFLRAFEPRLVGAVLEGTADEQSAVCLQLHADDGAAVVRFLQEHGIPFHERSRRMRLDRERFLEVATFTFEADGIAFDVTALPLDILRQAPLDRIDEKPMRRASLAQLETLLSEG